MIVFALALLLGINVAVGDPDANETAIAANRIATTQTKQVDELANCLARRGAGYAPGFCSTLTPIPTATPRPSPVPASQPAASATPEPTDAPAAVPPMPTPCWVTDPETGDIVFVPSLYVDGTPVLNDDGTQQYIPVPCPTLEAAQVFPDQPPDDGLDGPPPDQLAPPPADDVPPSAPTPTPVVVIVQRPAPPPQIVYIQQPAPPAAEPPTPPPAQVIYLVLTPTPTDAPSSTPTSTATSTSTPSPVPTNSPTATAVPTSAAEPTSESPVEESAPAANDEPIDTSESRPFLPMAVLSMWMGLRPTGVRGWLPPSF
jgi:hypothetical protein